MENPQLYNIEEGKSVHAPPLAGFPSPADTEPRDPVTTHSPNDNHFITISAEEGKEDLELPQKNAKQLGRSSVNVASIIRCVWVAACI
jgi:hypothetical protein